MAWPIYSTRFLKVAGAAGAYTYVIPAGHRAVVKSISVANGGAAPASVDVQLAGVELYLKVFQATNECDVMNLTAVGYGGEVIRGGLGTSGVHLIVSGFLFLDPGGGAAGAGGPLEPDFEPWPEPKL